MTVHWTAAAQADLLRIHRYIAARNPWAADKMTALFLRRAASLAVLPGQGRLRQPELRELVVHKRYRLQYRVDGDAIHVTRLVHAARDVAPDA